MHIGSRVLALSLAAAVATPAYPQEAAAPPRSSIFEPSRDPERRRSDVFVPLMSFVLPMRFGLPAGLDQWWEGQYGSAAVYTGVSLLGIGYAVNVANRNSLTLGGKTQEEEEGEGSPAPDDSDDETTIDSKNITVRKVTLGLLAHQGAAGISSYHAFRTAVRTRQRHGEYAFLKYEETPGDILMAPFRVSYLTRASTYVPLLIGAGLMGLILNSDPGDELVRSAFTPADGVFTSAFSYNAGTHEEAVFRGWMQPAMYEAWGSPFWANATQSVLFAAAHLSSNSMPLPQLLLGYHLGNVTMDDGWRVGEAVFIHVWWDVLAFTGVYHYKQKDKEPKADGTNWMQVASPKPLTLWLPPLHFTF